MAKVKDLTGREFGRLTVVALHPERSITGMTRWVCACACGATTVTRRDYLVEGDTSSCGCYRSEFAATRLRRSGSSSSRWVGDAVEYVGAHDRVRSVRGRASEYTCTDCTDQAHDWSYVYATGYSTNIEDYSPRCRRCHARYDSRAL